MSTCKSEQFVACWMSRKRFPWSQAKSISKDKVTLLFSYNIDDTTVTLPQRFKLQITLLNTSPFSPPVLLRYPVTHLISWYINQRNIYNLIKREFVDLSFPHQALWLFSSEIRLHLLNTILENEWASHSRSPLFLRSNVTAMFTFFWVVFQNS